MLPALLVVVDLLLLAGALATTRRVRRIAGIVIGTMIAIAAATATAPAALIIGMLMSTCLVQILSNFLRIVTVSVTQRMTAMTVTDGRTVPTVMIERVC